MRAVLGVGLKTRRIATTKGFSWPLVSRVGRILKMCGDLDCSSRKMARLLSPSIYSRTAVLDLLSILSKLKPNLFIKILSTSLFAIILLWLQVSTKPFNFFL